MDDARATGAPAGTPGAGSAWARRMRDGDAAPGDDGSAGGAPGDGRPAAKASSGGERDVLEEGLETLRRDAREAARADADEGRPAPDAEAPTEREASLRERCRSLFERWTLSERRRFRELFTDREQQAVDLIGRAGLLVDRFERLINELIRVKARRASDRRAAESWIGGRDAAGGVRGIPTKVYVAAIGFLGLVEFFANAPVFSTLLPRDPLTERQIRLLAETTTGWMAGAERVLAQLVLRPDAALLAAGVITFLCVLAHFFGHSLRDFVQQKDGRRRRDGTGTRSPLENMVPMVLTGLGLALVLGVLFEARVILGEVGERRYGEDAAAVAELRREAGWLRADGELLAANQRQNRADDMEAAAAQLREYAASMSRMTFPILLLNLTLVLAAVTAAYFHRRDGPERFDDAPYDDDREGLVEEAETTASEVARMLAQAVRPVRELTSLSEDGLSRDPAGVARELESVVALYRSENARARGLEAGAVAAFRGPVDLRLPSPGDPSGPEALRRAAEDVQADLQDLGRRFREARERFNEQLAGWETG